MRRSCGVVGILVAVACLLAGRLDAADEARVAEFSPLGTAKGVRQASARFSEPMVPLGDPRAPTPPFTVACGDAGGSGRWVDQRTWVWDFGRELPAGMECVFDLRAPLATLAGTPVGGERRFAFSTGGPAVESTVPQEEGTIAEDQAFVLDLDGAVDPASVGAGAYFAVDGVAERVGVRVLDGADRAAVLRAVPEWQREEPLLVVAATQRFPNGAVVRLHWPAGIRSPSGVSTAVAHEVWWKVRTPFLAEVRCERERADAGCIPLTPINLRLSASVTWADARRIVLIGPDDERWTPLDPAPDEAFASAVTFAPPFPPDTALRLELPADLHDDGGRALANAQSFPLAVKTGRYPPLAKFSARFGIIESKADGTLPVTVRDLEAGAGGRALRVGGRVGKLDGSVPASAMIDWLRRVAVATRDRSVFAGARDGVAMRDVKLPRSNGDSDFEVIGIPLVEPGLYVVELSSRRLGTALLGRDAPFYVPTAALVTNLAVHLKWGRDGSVVWVTSLDAGRPVANARVTVHDCSGRVLHTGTSDAQGLVRVANLPQGDALPGCNEERYQFPEEFFDYSQVRALSSLGGGLFVVARTDDDMSFVHSSWDDGLEGFRFDLPSEGWDGPMLAHTVLDRALLRAGDTVHMKHLLRMRTLAGFGAVPPAERPAVMSIRHLGSNERYDQPVTWTDGGVAESTWAIPKAAKLGRYEIVLVTPPAPGEPDWSASERTAGAFRVEEFRVPLMQGTLRLPSAPLLAPKKTAADVAVRYLAGGAATNLPVTVRGEVTARDVDSPPGLSAFQFANGPVRIGLRRSGEDEEEVSDGDDGTAPRTLPAQTIVLDAAGTARARIPLLPRADTPRRLLTELEFRDPNGEVQTVASSVALWPGGLLPGVTAERWVMEQGDLDARAAVIDVDGKPVAGAQVRIDVFDQRTYSTRTRVVGGFYAYQHVRDVQPVGELCRGATDTQGILACTGRPAVQGNVVLQASVTDAAGNTVTSHAEVWVARGEDFWFEAGDSDRIDLIPERRTYEPGETARFQVRMPFREATALVTVEREGVGDARVVPLSGSAPVIEVPIDGALSPNVFVSALVVRGRVGDVQPTAMVDLGRPAFRLGIAEIEVGWRDHTLDVAVTTDRPVYRVRETAAVTVTVRDAGGAPPPAGSEVALAAVDEGLLELAPNPTWKLLDAMMTRRGYGVQCATAQLQVVGKRHYGRKALPGGGGGGRQPTRELFDTLLLWRARVPLDAEGRAQVSVPLNDSLTSFRIVAVATGGLGRFGTGATSIRATQDLMTLAGLAPVVRSGDRYRAEFTLRNVTDRSMTVDAKPTVTGLATPLAPQELTIAAGQSTIVAWDVTAPAGVESLDWTLDVGEPGGAVDRLRVAQQVRPAVPVRTLQARLFQWSPEAKPVPIARPADALPDVGELAVGLGATLTTGLDGVRSWLRRYPYTCLEQRVSRAIGLRDEAAWREITAALPSHQDDDGLLKYFATMDRGSDVLTAYVLSIANAAGWTIPERTRNAMLEGLGRFAAGTLERPSRMPDRTIRKLAALDALSRYGKADVAVLDTIVVDPANWPTSAVLDWWGTLTRLPPTPQRAAQRTDAERLVRARLDLSGTTLRFATAKNDDLWWLMTGPDTNALRLMPLLLASGAWKDDQPRLMRGALALQQRGAWSTTVANAWGVLAVDTFARVHERTPVTGTTTAALGTATKDVVWRDTPGGTTLAFPWPPAQADLTIAHAGAGRPWVTVQSRAAVPLKEPLASGYRITRTVTPLAPAVADHLKRDDRLRVRLEIEAQSDMGWVVVDDPIPAGASHVAAGSLAAGAPTPPADDDGPTPAFVERSFTAYRAYYEYVPAGRFTLEYVVRLSQAGTFELPPTRVEALYAPDSFGEVPNPPVVVE